MGLLAAMGVQFLIPIPGVPAGAAIPQARPLPAVPIPSAFDDQQALAHPLFAPSRGGAEAGGGEAGAVLADYTFSGAILARGAGAAIVRGPGGVVRTLRPGDTLLGWRVAGVRRDQLLLQRQSEQLAVPVNSSLSGQPGSSPPSAAPVGAPRIEAPLIGAPRLGAQ